MQVEDFGLQLNGFKQGVHAIARQSGDMRYLYFAAHGFDLHFVLQQLLFNLERVGVGLVALVDRHDHRNFGGLGMCDGFLRLRHDAVISRNHQNDHVRHCRATGTHLSKGGVARGVEESNELSGR